MNMKLNALCLLVVVTQLSGCATDTMPSKETGQGAKMPITKTADDLGITGDWVRHGNSFSGRNGFLFVELPREFKKVSFSADVESTMDFHLLFTDQRLDWNSGFRACLGGWANRRSVVTRFGAELPESTIMQGMPNKWHCDMTYSQGSLKIFMDGKSFMDVKVSTPKIRFFSVGIGWESSTTLSNPKVIVE